MALWMQESSRRQFGGNVQCVAMELDVWIVVSTLPLSLANV